MSDVVTSNTAGTAPNDSAPPPPAMMMQMITGGWVAQSVYVVAKLGIADLVKEAPQTVADLAQQSGAHAQSLYRVLRALISVGLFCRRWRRVHHINSHGRVAA